MFFSYFFQSARVTFVTAKVTKITAPNTLPCGFPAMLVEFGAAQLAALKQCSLNPEFHCASRQRISRGRSKSKSKTLLKVKAKMEY